MSMLTKNTEKFLADAREHVARDLVRGGSYRPDSHGRACFVGCHTGGNMPGLLGVRYGLPLVLVRIAEDIFERLPRDEQPKFHLEIAEAVAAAGDGRDLTRVPWAYLADVLRRAREHAPKARRVIDRVIAGLDLLAAGKPWDVWGAQAAAVHAAIRAENEAWEAIKAAHAAWAATQAAAAAWAWAAARAAAWAAVNEAQAAAWAAVNEPQAAAWAAQAAAWAAQAVEHAARGAENAAAETQHQRAALLRLIRNA